MALPSQLFNFETFEDVSAWCAANGGEPALLEAMSHGFAHTRAMMDLCERWLAYQAGERASADTRAAVAAAVASAKSSERSARYTMWSACISAVALIIAALTYLFKA